MCIRDSFPVEPGDRVLDLCAAPGGKATELGAKLKREGVLVANDISNSRAKALLHNLELFGIPNLFVTNETPDNLAFRFPGFFDKILVDAPCSGEGMFRKDPAAVKAWYPGKPGECAALQKEILKSAAEMLAPGGLLLYSTCTFAPEENEGTISWLLEEYPCLLYTSRLGVLTEKVAKPAVSFGGKYRIIDFPLSNCINSGVDTVGVLTQYQPLRLNTHIGIGIPWDLDRNVGGVTVLSPYEKSDSSEWYTGTANAI